MAKTFNTAKSQFSDQLSDANFATEVNSWLNGLSIGTDHTVYCISCEHLHGFWVIVIIYEP